MIISFLPRYQSTTGALPNYVFYLIIYGAFGTPVPCARSLFYSFTFRHPFEFIMVGSPVLYNTHVFVLRCLHPDIVNNNDICDPSLTQLSGKKKMTCDAALSMFQDQDASCHDDLGFGPLSKPCPVTCGICKASEEKRAVVIALHMIRAALAAMDEEEQSQVMAGLWADAEIKGMTPALNKEEL